MRNSVRTLPPPELSSSSRRPQQPRSSVSPPPVISLVRPGPRSLNEYVDTPASRRPPPPPTKQHQQISLVNEQRGRFLPDHQTTGHSPGSPHRLIFQPSTPLSTHRQQGRVTSSPGQHEIGGGHTTSTVGGGGGGGRGTSVAGNQTVSPHQSSSPVISSQPAKSPPLKKEVASLLEDSQHRTDDCGGLSHTAGGDGGIICDRCGKCQCAAHTEQRPLPSHWCCGDSCELSPDKVLDCCTCYCCVKCAFYHFGGPEEDNECYERPCGCLGTRHCCRRWTALAAMALCLPCLCAYWPARACLAGCTATYNRCRRRKGCQCHRKAADHTAGVGGGGGGVAPTSGQGVGGGGGVAVSKHSQTRRLLIESDSSSA